MSREPIFDVCDAPQTYYPLWLQWPATARIAVPLGQCEIEDDVMLVRYDSADELYWCVAVGLGERTVVMLWEEMAGC